MSLFDNRNLFSEEFSKFMKRGPIGEFIHDHPFLFLAVIGVIVGACTGGIATVIAVAAIIGGIILDDVSSNNSFILRKISSFFKMFKTGSVGNGLDDKSEGDRTSYERISDNLPSKTLDDNSSPPVTNSCDSSTIQPKIRVQEKQQVLNPDELNDQNNSKQTLESNFKPQ